jgi:hypothetical protein
MHHLEDHAMRFVLTTEQQSYPVSLAGNCGERLLASVIRTPPLIVGTLTPIEATCCRIELQKAVKGNYILDKASLIAA